MRCAAIAGRSAKRSGWPPATIHLYPESHASLLALLIARFLRCRSRRLRRRARSQAPSKRQPDYKFDVVGVLGLAMISAIGGGAARDILIQHCPPLALLDVRYLLVALSGGLVGLLARLLAGSPLTRLLLVVEAAALGLFAVAGATRALDAGLYFLPALLLGITSAVGGGSLRDVFSGRAPRIFERGELHANTVRF